MLVCCHRPDIVCYWMGLESRGRNAISPFRCNRRWKSNLAWECQASLTEALRIPFLASGYSAYILLFFFLLLLNGLNKNCGFQALLQLGFWKMCCLLTSWVFRDNGSCLYSGYWLHRIVFELGSLAISRSPHPRERQVLNEVSLVGKFVSVVATSHPFLGPSNHFCKLWIPGVLSISTSEVWFWSQEPICQSG